MSAINTGPRGTATTASNESAGELPPSALAVTTACPRVSPVTVPAAETEAAEGFRLTYVTSGFATGSPKGSCTVTVVPAVEPTSTISDFGVRTRELGAPAPTVVAVTMFEYGELPTPLEAPTREL